MSKLVKYSKEFKLDALNLLQEGKSVSDISKSYQLHGDKAFQGPGIRLPKNEQQEELRGLKKENADLKMERDILKKALSIFSKSGQ